jgi:hypothetical protein
MIEKEETIFGAISISRGQIPLIGFSTYSREYKKIEVLEFSDTWIFSILIQQIGVYSPSTIILSDGQEMLMHRVRYLK